MYPVEVYEQTNLWKVNICKSFSHFYFEPSMWFATAYSFGHDSVYTRYAPDVGIAVKLISTTITMFQNFHPYLWLETFLKKPGQMCNSHGHQKER